MSVLGLSGARSSGYIACDVGGMTHDACLLALNRWFDIVEDHLGWHLNDLEILTFECNKDYPDVRLDGVECITKTNLYGMIERVYQKEENLVRRERKFTKKMSVTKFEETLKKSFADSEKSQDRYELKQEVRRNSEALKFTNSRILQVERLTEAVFQTLGKLAKVDDLEAAAEKIAANVNKLNEALGKLGDSEVDPTKVAEGQKRLGEYTV